MKVEDIDDENYTSVFDLYDKDIKEHYATALKEKDVINFSTECYVRFKNKITDEEEKVVFTQKDMIFTVNSGSKLTEVNINYRISWFETLPRERSTNHENKGVIRLTSRGIVIELLFSAKDSYKATKKFQTKYAINVDFEEKYQLVEKQGKGASAEVYSIVDPDTGKQYAGKFISKKYLRQTPKRIVSIISEMEILRKLDHPNIIKIYEVHEIEDYFIIVLELLEGPSLRPELLSKTRSVQNRNADLANICSQIVMAQKYLNDKGFMHRDLKPGNQKFAKEYKTSSPDNTIKLIDFGFIERFGDQRYTRYYCGTVGYMCPFIMNNDKKNPKNYGPEVDLYSQGSLLYYSGTGHKQYKGSNREEKRKLNSQNKFDVESIDTSDKLSEDGKDLVKKLLVGDPERRQKINNVITHPFFKNNYQNGTLQITTDTTVNNYIQN